MNKPEIDYERLKEEVRAYDLALAIAIIFNSGTYNDKTRIAKIAKEIIAKGDGALVCSMLVIDLQGCNPKVSYGHQLLDEMLACQHKHKVGLAKLREGIEATFTAAAKEEKGDDWREAVIHSLECLLAAGLTESARQLELRRN